MALAPALICPKCGATMNHHADKLINTFDAAASSASDMAILEFHACPGCGYSSSRAS